MSQEAGVDEKLPQSVNPPGPRAHYQAALDRGEILPDDMQMVAVTHLQKLYDQLCASPSEESGLLAKLFRIRSRHARIEGLYFWGGVGRGKTFLMDVFYDSLPFKQKSRMHFHRFMRQVHQHLKELQGEKNPLKEVARRFASESRVLCFDEFFISDITDAMLMTGLLEALFAHGMVLVATSNVPPGDLYRDGLQRRKFLPAIDLLEQHTQVVNVDGGIDYRLRVLESAEIYHYPLDEAADVGLAASFKAICPDDGGQQVRLDIEGRQITARQCGDGVAWFDFYEICDGPRSQNDYIELAMLFQTVLISAVPRFGSPEEDQARRFISLVDEFYDRNVKLILSAEVPIPELYQGVALEFEFQRTESRLQEMQSHDYLAREHRP